MENNSTFHSYLHHAEVQYGRDVGFEEKLGYANDTVELAKKAIQVATTWNILPSYGFGALYQYVTGTNMESAHQAMDDVNGTVSILQHMPFLEH